MARYGRGSQSQKDDNTPLAKPKRPGRAFYAIRQIMGRSRRHGDTVYRERISDDRLRMVVEHDLALRGSGAENEEVTTGLPCRWSLAAAQRSNPAQLEAV